MWDVGGSGRTERMRGHEGMMGEKGGDRGGWASHRKNRVQWGLGEGELGLWEREGRKGREERGRWEGRGRELDGEGGVGRGDGRGRSREERMGEGGAERRMGGEGGGGKRRKRGRGGGEQRDHSVERHS